MALLVPTDPDRRQQIREAWALSLFRRMQQVGVSRRDLQRLLSDRGVDVTDQAIGCWLRAETAPRIEIQATIASALKIPVRKLFPVESAEAVA